MRSLALARLHYLSRTRSAFGPLVISIGLALFFLIVQDSLYLSSSEEWSDIETLLWDRARNATVIYFFHLIVLFVACDLFGTPRPARDGARPADLTETTPLEPPERFLGDALGIFQSVAVIHVCTLPLLALAVALSPLPTSLFFWAEGLTLAVMIFGSASASWKLRSTGRWTRTRSARSLAMFFILLFAVLISTTEWAEFRQAAMESLVQPSPATWRWAASLVPNPPLLLGSLFLLYAGYIAYYTFSSIRALNAPQQRSWDRIQENVHAL